MLESERRALVEVEDAIASARAAGAVGRLLPLLERALDLRVRVFGPESLHVHKACKDLSDALNGVALIHLQNEEFEEALQVLRKAEVLTGPGDLITAVTYNNMACYYRRKGKLRTALQYLQKALKIETRAKVVVNPAGTRLNLCAVLSQLGRHQQALEQAQASVILLQEELVSQATQQDTALSLDGSPELLNKMAVLAISYHNLGVEQEYLKRLDGCLESYQKGFEIASYYLGDENDITKTLKQSFLAASKHVEKLQVKNSIKAAVTARRENQSVSAAAVPDVGGGVYSMIQERTRLSRRPSASGSRPTSAMWRESVMNHNNGNSNAENTTMADPKSESKNNWDSSGIGRSASAFAGNAASMRRPLSATIAAARDGAGRPASAMARQSASSAGSSLVGRRLPPRPASALPYYTPLQPAVRQQQQQRPSAFFRGRDDEDDDYEFVKEEEDEDEDEEKISRMYQQHQRQRRKEQQQQSLLKGPISPPVSEEEGPSRPRVTSNRRADDNSSRPMQGSDHRRPGRPQSAKDPNHRQQAHKPVDTGDSEDDFVQNDDDDDNEPEVSYQATQKRNTSSRGSLKYVMGLGDDGTARR